MVLPQHGRESFAPEGAWPLRSPRAGGLFRVLGGVYPTPLGVGGGTGGWGTVGHLLRAHNAKAKNPNRHTHDIPSTHKCATSCVRYVFRLHKSLAKCATSTYNLHTEARRAAGAAVRTVELFSLHCGPLRYRPRGETCFRFPLVSESVGRRAY